MKKEKDYVITEDMTIASVLKLDKAMADVFMGFGMFCIFCHLSEDETIAEASQVHGVDSKFLVAKLNEIYSQNKK